MSVFESVITVVFQSIFYLKIYQNNFFYFLKIIFNIYTPKYFENIKNINFKQRKKIIKKYFFKKRP